MRSGENTVGQNLQSNIIRLYIIKLSKWLMLTMPILFLFYKENGLSTRELFLLKAAYSFAIVALEVPSGYLGDIWGRKASLVLGSVLGFAGFAIYSVSTGFWPFLACEMILGAGQSFISGSDSALLYDTLQGDGREKSYLKIEGRMISAGNFAEAVAGPLGVAIAALSLRTTFFFQAAVAFAAIPAALTLVEPARKKMTGKADVRQILGIIRFAMQDHKGLQATIFYSSIMGTATLTMAWFVQPFFVHLSLPMVFFGIFIPLLNVTTGFVSMHAFRVEERLGRRGTIWFIVLGITAGYLSMGIFQAQAALVFLFLFYMVRGVATPVLRNQINEITPSNIRATILSIRSMVIRLTFVLIGPVLGWQADRAGLPWALVGGGIFFLAAGLASAIYLLRTTETPMPQPGVLDEKLSG